VASLLKKRIVRQTTQAGNMAPLSEVGLPPGAPSASPSSIIYVYAPSTVGLGPTSPIVTADGALIPATMPGGWDQLRAVGRPLG
jgi:hypothetical protein